MVPEIILLSYRLLEVLKPRTSNAFDNVNPVLVRLGSVPVRFCVTKSILCRFDAAVRELFEEIGLSLTVDYPTLLSGNHVRVPLLGGHYKLVYVFSA
jgi:8-oxo-dGTP pyrophosphatase MutT (NUDIX family)